MQIMHFILDKTLKLLTYYMPFYHQSLQSYLISKTVRFFLAYPVSLASCDLDLGALNPKIDHFMPVPHGPLVQSDIKIGSLVFKILCLQVWKQLNGQTDGWMNGWTT